MSFEENFQKALAATAAPKRETPIGWDSISINGYFKFAHEDPHANVLQKISGSKYKFVASGDEFSVGITQDAYRLRDVTIVPTSFAVPERKPSPAREQAPAGSPSLRRDRLSGRSWLMFLGRPNAEVIAKLKASGWRWSGFRKEWHHPSKFAQPPVPFVDEGLVDYSEERAGRLEERAAKVGAEAQGRYERAHSIAAGIPMGQPILVGHHSEKRHRRDIERIHSGLGKAFEGFEKQKELATSARASSRLQEKKVSDPGMISRRLKKAKGDLGYMTRMLPNVQDATEYERRIEIVREGISRDEELLAAAGPAPEGPGAMAKVVKAYLRKSHPTVKVTSSSGRSQSVGAWIPMVGDFRTMGGAKEGGAFSAELRNAALDAIYGPEFERNRDHPNAGNVSASSITMSADKWKVALGAIGVRI